MALSALNKVWPVKARGATIQITSAFFDAFAQVAQPPAAQVNITYPKIGGGTTTVLVQMTQQLTGAAAGKWVAQWDSRNAAPGTVYWSVETPGSPPVSVEDGQFTLSANLANQATF